jgi:hypothetical protein
MATLSLGDFGLMVVPADDDEEDFEGLEEIDEEHDNP